MKQTYLIFAIVGAVVPILFFVGVFHTHMVGPVGFVPALFANSAAAGFSADLLITSFVFWIFMFNAKAGLKPWLYVILNLTIGLSCALPAYLYARERTRVAAA
jgi:hypothetical protein